MMPPLPLSPSHKGRGDLLPAVGGHCVAGAGSADGNVTATPSTSQ